MADSSSGRTPDPQSANGSSILPSATKPMTQKQKKAIETARACKNCKVKEDLVIEKGKTTTITDENGKVTHKTASDKQWDFCSVNTCKKHSRLFFD